VFFFSFQLTQASYFDERSSRFTSESERETGKVNGYEGTLINIRGLRLRHRVSRPCVVLKECVVALCLCKTLPLVI